MDLLISLPLLLTVIASLLQKSSAVQCFVCSWSPNDVENRTDWCTPDHFEPKVVYIHDCELGCETYVQWDKNEELEQWRRNCFQIEASATTEASTVTGRCVQEEDKARTWRRCTCDTDLCNSAISWSSTSLLTSLLISLSLLRYYTS